MPSRVNIDQKAVRALVGTSPRVVSALVDKANEIANLAKATAPKTHGHPMWQYWSNIHVKRFPDATGMWSAYVVAERHAVVVEFGNRKNPTWPTYNLANALSVIAAKDW